MLGIKSDRTHRAAAHSRKGRGIMGVSVASALSPLERYQPSGCSVTPSLQIPSSLRQFHSPLPASVTQSLFTLPSHFPLRPQTYIIPLLPRGSAPLWRRDAASRIPSFPTPSNVSQVHKCTLAFLVAPSLADRDTRLCQSPVRCASSHTKLTVGELPGATSRRGPCQSCVSGP